MILLAIDAAPLLKVHAHVPPRTVVQPCTPFTQPHLAAHARHDAATHAPSPPPALPYLFWRRLQTNLAVVILSSDRGRGYSRVSPLAQTVAPVAIVRARVTRKLTYARPHCVNDNTLTRIPPPPPPSSSLPFSLPRSPLPCPPCLPIPLTPPPIRPPTSPRPIISLYTHGRPLGLAQNAGPNAALPAPRLRRVSLTSNQLLLPGPWS